MVLSGTAVGSALGSRTAEVLGSVLTLSGSGPPLSRAPLAWWPAHTFQVWCLCSLDVLLGVPGLLALWGQHPPPTLVFFPIHLPLDQLASFGGWCLSPLTTPWSSSLLTLLPRDPLHLPFPLLGMPIFLFLAWLLLTCLPPPRRPQPPCSMRPSHGLESVNRHPLHWHLKQSVSVSSLCSSLPGTCLSPP